MEQTTGVAVLATQCAGTDRRALSQAWYDALHIAEHGNAPARSASSHGVRSGATETKRPPALAQRNSAPSPSAATGAPRRDGRAVRATTIEAARIERRAAAETFATAIARRIATRTPRAGVLSFSLTAESGERVHVIVRAQHGRVRVLALCTPALQRRVERALAHARFALAAGGGVA